MSDLKDQKVVILQAGGHGNVDKLKCTPGGYHVLEHGICEFRECKYNHPCIS